LAPANAPANNRNDSDQSSTEDGHKEEPRRSEAEVPGAALLGIIQTITILALAGTTVTHRVQILAHTIEVGEAHNRKTVHLVVLDLEAEVALAGSISARGTQSTGSARIHDATALTDLASTWHTSTGVSVFPEVASTVTTRVSISGIDTG